MGIKSLMKLLSSDAPKSFKETNIKSYFSRSIAIDASMTLYQFLIAVRHQDQGQLTNEFGEVTSHVIGFFYRTIRMMENGVKPVYVFDGKPPDFKGEELKKRAEKRAQADSELKVAEEEGDQARVNQLKKRLVKVTKKHVEDVKQLLTAMGVPWIQAPGEAEAQCAEMCKKGVVYGTGTEDMDALTFGTPVLLRHLTKPASRKLPVLEITLSKILAQLGLTMAEFIDMCILCGCDYVKHIKGIGPKKALALVRKHSNIETILENLDTNRYEIPNATDFNYVAARRLFVSPDVLDCTNMKIVWNAPNEQRLVEFLVDEKAFSKERVVTGMKRLQLARKKGAQKRLDCFFKPMPAKNTNSNSKSKPKSKSKSKSKSKATKSKSKPKAKAKAGATKLKSISKPKSQSKQKFTETKMKTSSIGKKRSRTEMTATAATKAKPTTTATTKTEITSNNTDIAMHDTDDTDDKENNNNSNGNRNGNKKRKLNIVAQ